MRSDRDLVQAQIFEIAGDLGDIASRISFENAHASNPQLASGASTPQKEIEKLECIDRRLKEVISYIKGTHHW